MAQFWQSSWTVSEPVEPEAYSTAAEQLQDELMMESVTKAHLLSQMTKRGQQVSDEF